VARHDFGATLDRFEQIYHQVGSRTPVLLRAA
jgi:hypothetical protein